MGGVGAGRRTSLTSDRAGGSCERRDKERHSRGRSALPTPLRSLVNRVVSFEGDRRAIGKAKGCGACQCAGAFASARMDVAMRIIGWLPVCPKSWGVHLAQAPTLAAARPGQWLAGLTGLRTSAHEERWTVTRPGQDSELTTGEVAELLGGCKSLERQETDIEHIAICGADFVPQEVVSTPTGHRFTAWFFTSRKQWLDVIEIELSQPQDSAGGVQASAYSFSSAMVPASVPFALPLSAVLSFFPFSDIGQNAIHLRTLRLMVSVWGNAMHDLTSRLVVAASPPPASHRLAPWLVSDCSWSGKGCRCSACRP